MRFVRLPVGGTLQRLRPHHTMQDCRGRLFTTHYYDSQSGMHVPLHNENEIFVYAKQQQHQQDELIFDFQNKKQGLLPSMMESLKQRGFRGASILGDDILSSNSNRNTSSLDLDLGSIVSANDDSGFTFFVPAQFYKNEKVANNVSWVFEYNADSDNNRNDNDAAAAAADSLREILSQPKYQTASTTIALFHKNNYENSDPIDIANGVATLIDSTGGGDCVWISAPSSSSSEEKKYCDKDNVVVSLCEELCYLDVVGPIMKSRLIVDESSLSEEGMEEVLALGVNKFMIDASSKKYEQFREMVAEHGKRLIC